MAPPRPFPPEGGPDPFAYGPPGSRHGLTGGQLAFDFLFGLVCPLALFLLDPAVFGTSVADRAALPSYWRGPTYPVAGALGLCLFVWLVAGPRHPRLGILFAGLFALGGLLSTGLAFALVGFGLSHVPYLSGVLALTPWLTAFVFMENCVRAVGAGTRASGILAVGSLLVGCFVPLVIFGAVLGRLDERAKLLEAQLLSTSRADHQHALGQIRGPRDVDFDRIAAQYDDLDEDDPRRPRIEQAYLRLTGAPIDAALERLRPRIPDAQPPEAEKPKTLEDRARALVDQLFSADTAQHAKAADELTGNPDVDLDAIVRRYRELDPNDPRRPNIEAAYRQIAAEPIEHALQRLERREKRRAKDELPRTSPKAPETSPAPSRPTPGDASP